MESAAEEREEALVAATAEVEMAEETAAVREGATVVRVVGAKARGA